MNRISKIFVLGLAIVALAGFGKIGITKAAATPGSLIKMNGLSSVYYLGADSKRYVFPNSTVYFSWYKDFSGVVTISQSELESYPLAANITMRPGTRLVKITTNPKVYAVEPGGTLRAIPDEATAVALYGSNWNKRVSDVADAFFTNYKTGNALAANEVPAGSLVKNAGNAAVYYFDGTNYRTIADEAAFNANRFSFDNVMTISNTITAGGTAITANEFANPDSSATGQGTQPGQGTGLTVALSASTPASTNVPNNGSRVVFTKVNLTASNDGAINLETMTIKRTGLSDYGDFNRVWAEKSGVIVASKKTMNSNDETVLNFSPVLNIPAGQTVTIDIAASLSNAAGNAALSIQSASAVGARGASISGSFPIIGNSMSFTNYTVVDLSYDGEGTTDTIVRVGDENVELGKFDIEFGTTTRDSVLSSISLKNTDGTEDLSKVLMNVYLENNGNRVSENATFSGKYATFVFKNGGFNMAKDDGDQSFKIKGDVIAKESTSNSDLSVKLVLDKADQDLMAIESNTGFGANITGNTENAAQILIEAGYVTISKKSTSPADSNVIKGSKGVVALIANVKADEAINADGMYINMGDNTTNASSSFENVKVYVNNALIDSFDPTGDTGEINLDSSLNLVKGDNEIKVILDVKSNATSTGKIRVKLIADGSGSAEKRLLDSAEYSTTGNSVTSSRISGSASGALISVGGASFTAVRNDGYSSAKKIVKGSNDVSLGKFALQAKDDTVTVTSVSLSANNADGTNKIAHSSVYDMKLFIDGVQHPVVRDFNGSGATFSSLTWNIADNQTKIVELKGSFDTAATGTLRTTLTFGAQDSRGKTITEQTATTTDFLVVTEGTVNVVKDGDSPVDAILVSNPSVEQEVAKFKLTANDDVANVTEISIANFAGGSLTAAADPRISAYKLYQGTTLLGSVVPVSGAGKFVISNNALSIPADGNRVVSIKVALNQINNDANATNKDVQVKITELKFKSSNGSELTSGDTATANSFRIRKTVPTVSLAALPTTILENGDMVVSKFTVTADSNADVKLNKLVIKYSNTASATLATLVNGLKINGSVKAVTSTVDTGAKTITLTGINETIAAGSSKTVEIMATVGVTGNNRESITTKIEEDASYDTDGNFVWSDNAANGSDTDSNAKRVLGLPTNTQSISIN